MIKVPRQWRRRAHELVLSLLPRVYAPSDKPLTVMIPLAVKDVVKAGRAVESLRGHLRHPVEDMIVVGQDSEALRNFCAKASVRYINENEVLPPQARMGAKPVGPVKVNGWLRQQLLKLTVFSYIDSQYILVFDADTFLVRDLSYLDGDRQILWLADEYTKSYHNFTQKLLGPIPRHPRSFIAHYMLFQKDIMQALEGAVRQQTGDSLVEAILHNLPEQYFGVLSEYELYGNFLYHHFPDRCRTAYWYNRKIPPDNVEPLSVLSRRFRRFNAVSSHLHSQ